MSKTMKAAVLHAPGDLRIEQVEIPKPNENEALIRVKAAGICGSDLDRVMKTGTYKFPTVPGHEFCGQIAYIPDNTEGFKIGDKVAVAPILPCYKCDNCQQGKYGQCINYNYLGSRTDGGFAEYVCAPVKNLIKLPESIPYSVGAAIEPAAVTLHGIMRLNIQAGDTVAVLGCGTIGLFAIQFAKIMGAGIVLAMDIDDERLTIAKQSGADLLFNAKDPHVISKMKEAAGEINIVVETAGVSITQIQSIELVKTHGQILYLGTAHKDVSIPPHTFERIVRGEISITGSWNSFSAPFPGREWSSVITYLTQGRLELEAYITHKFPLEKAPEVIKSMSEKQFTFNKVVLEI